MKIAVLKISLAVSVVLFLGAGCNKPFLKREYTDRTSSTVEPTSTEEIVAKITGEKNGNNMSDRAYWYKQLKWPASCEKTFENTNDNTEESDGGMAFYRVDAKTNLVRITCDRFAYQDSMIFMLVQLSESGTVTSAKLLKLPIYDLKANKVVPVFTPDVLGTDSFDTTNNTLRIFEKARGVGDCGDLEIYSVTTSSVELQAEHALECDTDFYEKNHITSENYQGPESWPLIFMKKI